MDNDIDIFNLINRQFSKQISKEEEAVLKAWYENSAENKQVYKEYYLLIKGLRISQNKKFFSSQIGDAYAGFARKTGLKQKESRRYSVPRSWMRYAAVLP